jgi:hypothetical protein
VRWANSELFVVSGLVREGDTLGQKVDSKLTRIKSEFRCSVVGSFRSIDKDDDGCLKSKGAHS